MKHIFEFDTGMKVEVNDSGLEIVRPTGEKIAFDDAGNFRMSEYMIGVKAKFGDYVEIVPSTDRCTISMMESGYSEEQSFATGKLNKWRVLFVDEVCTIVVSTESAGVLKLNGLPGYKNCASILDQISRACVNEKNISFTGALGMTLDNEWNVRVDDISKITERSPYSIDEREDCIVDGFRALGIKTSNGVWLASRYLQIVNGDYYFGVNCIRDDGAIAHEILNKSYIAGSCYSKTACCDVFPIIGIDSFSIVCGSGTEDDPYKII